MMKCIIEFELPDNDTVLKDIKVEPVHWAYHGYSGYCKAKQKAERKKGKWIFKAPPDDWFVLSLYRCSQCNQLEESQSKYCPNCGAEMVGET